MSDQSKPGDKVGYVVLEQDKWGGWMETSSGLLDTIGQAVAQLTHYQGIAPGRTWAVGRVHLSMISRPS